MATEIIKVPDIGEGVAEVEVVEWNVAIGERVEEDELLASVMTDKAAVEIPSPVGGVVVWLSGAIGDVLAVGSDFVKIDTDQSVTTEQSRTIAGDTAAFSGQPTAQLKSQPTKPVEQSENSIKSDRPADPVHATTTGSAASSTASPDTSSLVRGAGADDRRPLASPAVRKRARETGIDLREVAGSGPAGRISNEDLDAFTDQTQALNSGRRADASIERIELIGMRRRIAERMQLSKQRIPHFSYVEEIDLTTLMELRDELNENRSDNQVKLSILPFIISALVKALPEFPQINARFNDDEGYVEHFGGIHVGIATQTPNGLVVPVVAHAESRDIWDNAGELSRVADAARSGTLKREEMSGSTITVTSLGALGGIVTTPVINYPEVAIIGVNKIATRPVWIDDGVVPRQLMNLSSSFDHRIVDGWDAALFIQRLKSLLEFPATMFMER